MNTPYLNSKKHESNNVGKSVNKLGGNVMSYWMTIQKLKKWCSFWIQKFRKYCDFWIQKSWKWTKIFLDPDIVEMLRFLDPETAVFLQFLDPEIVEMDQKISGSRNCRNGAISGSRNRRKGRQILYDCMWENRFLLHLNLTWNCFNVRNSKWKLSL